MFYKIQLINILIALIFFLLFLLLDKQNKLIINKKYKFNFILFIIISSIVSSYIVNILYGDNIFIYILNIMTSYLYYAIYYLIYIVIESILNILGIKIKIIKKIK